MRTLRPIPTYPTSADLAALRRSIGRRFGWQRIGHSAAADWHPVSGGAYQDEVDHGMSPDPLVTAWGAAGDASMLRRAATAMRERAATRLVAGVWAFELGASERTYGSPAWCYPLPQEVCRRDMECGHGCELDDYGTFLVDGRRGGNGDPIEDVMFECPCEHHEP